MSYFFFDIYLLPIIIRLQYNYHPLQLIDETIDMESSDYNNNKKRSSCLKEATMTIPPEEEENSIETDKNVQNIIINGVNNVGSDNSVANIATATSLTPNNSSTSSSSSPLFINNNLTQDEFHNNLNQAQKFMKASYRTQPFQEHKTILSRSSIANSTSADPAGAQRQIDDVPYSNSTNNNASASMSTTTYSIYNLPAPSTSFTAGPSGLATKQRPQQEKHNHQQQQQLNQQSLPQQSQPAQSIGISSNSNNSGLNPLLTNEIESLFECPICFDYATPPIYQCQNGHLVCNGCSSKINQCATCRVPITNPSIRNLQLDRLANSFQIPCKYNFNGCDWKSYWFQKRDHEESCKYISLTCPCPGTTCKWSGLLSEVMNHLGDQHKSITTLSGEDIVFLATDINLKGAVDWVMIQSCFNHHFLLVLEKQEFKSGQQLFFAVVQLIGSKKDAEKFRYKLELGGNTSGHSRRLQWEARTNSVLDGIQSAITSHDCLVFDARMAEHFLTNIHQMDKETCNSNRKANNPNTDDNHNNQPNHHQDENLAINVTIERCRDMS